MARTKPRMPRSVTAVTSDIGEGRYPRALLVATIGWTLLAVMLLISRIGAPDTTDAEQTDTATGIQAIRAPQDDAQWFAPYLPWVGVVVLVLAVLLFVGQGWTRLVLALLGLLSVVGLAALASWLTIPAALFLVVGVVGGVTITAHRYVTGKTRVASPGGPEKPKVS